MHEANVTQALIQSVLAACEENQVKLVKEVVVDIGTFASFEKEPITYYFDLMKKDHEQLNSTTITVNMVDGEQIMLKNIEVD